MKAMKKDLYWYKLVAHYYDYIHWDVSPTISIYEWLKRDYDAYTDLAAEHIYFYENSKANWFHLRWG